MMRKHLLNTPFLATLACLVVSAASAQVIINEFSASNYTLGVNGDNEDYIEFYNEGPTEVDLDGHWLSDNPDNPQMFEIPAGTTVPAGGYLLIICSNEGEVPENLYVGGSLNTNFKVTQTMGESVVFSDPAGNILESYTFYEDWTPTQADHSWSRDADGSAGQWRVCTNPTPGNPNGGNLYTEYAPTPQFQEESGYYAGGTNVAITAPAGYDIRYTTDGYAPTPGSPLYTGPIAVNETTVIRARCLTRLAPTRIRTSTPTPISPAMTTTASSWFRCRRRTGGRPMARWLGRRSGRAVPH